MKKGHHFFLLAIVLIATSCNDTKLLYRGNTIYTYLDNRKKSTHDTIAAMELNNRLRVTIEDKTDYLIIQPYSNKKIIRTRPPFTDSIQIKYTDPRKIHLGNKLYFPETIYTKPYSQDNDPNRDSTGILQPATKLIYGDHKIGLQALTIPLKFRPALRNDSLYPSQAETGFNIGISPMAKFNLNTFNPTRKVMGKNTSTWSLAGGALLALGATDLKKTGNAPGIKSDRKSAIFTYGGFVMISFNTVNIGYAFGFDNVMGEGRKNWVYQNKIWHGLIIALDIVKI